MSYASPADFQKRFDERTLKDLASDSDTPVADLTNDPNTLAALEDASGRVDAAIMVAEMYSPDDLAALTGNSLALLKRIVCDLALVNLMARRPEKYSSDGFKALDERSESYLERLRRGERLFVVADNQEAGLPSVDGPSAVDIDEDHLNLVTSRVHNFFPSPARRLPFNRGA